jgi:14-3-3 protein epsilon
MMTLAEVVLRGIDVFGSHVTLASNPSLLTAIRNMANKDKCVYFAKLAEQAERYDEMAEHMQTVGALGGDLSVEERNLLSVAYKNAVGSRRAAWRIISSVEQKETSKGNNDNAGFAKEYRAKVEKELHEICGKILNLMKDTLIPKAGAGESAVFYHKMMGDYYRYIAEFTDGDAKKTAADDARVSYEKATECAAKDLAVTHPIRLGLALNYSVFQYEVLQNPDEACKMARTAFEDAIAELDNVAEATIHSQSRIKWFMAFA